MKTYLNHGYNYVALYKNGKYKNFKIFRLVGEAFLYKGNGLNVINHKDGDKSNDDVSNLEWCDVSYNTKHAYDIGLSHTDKSWDDSQSIHVEVEDTIKCVTTKYGSISEASRELNISKSVIARRIKLETPKKYKQYIFRKSN